MTPQVMNTAERKQVMSISRHCNKAFLFICADIGGLLWCYLVFNFSPARRVTSLPE